MKMIFKPTLRKKLLFFSVILAIIPLGLAGRTMITITQDELKSAANDELSVTAGQLSQDIDELFIDTWRAPLVLTKNAMEIDNFDITAIDGLLRSTAQTKDFLLVQATLKGIPPVTYSNRDIQIPLIKQSEIDNIMESSENNISDVVYDEKNDLWYLTIILPLDKKIRGFETFLAARVDLSRLMERINSHPFTKTGKLLIVNNNGRQLFNTEQPDLTNNSLVSTGLDLLNAGSRPITTQPYTKPDGSKMLGAFSFPQYFDWMIVSERSEDDAYAALQEMLNSLFIWVAVGLLVAVIGGVFFSARISKPILEIGDVASEVGHGNFSARVSDSKSNDEIAELGSRMNQMIKELRERFELQKFVSGQTISAIQSREDGIQLGGERKTATVFFSDIRGFTAFSEKVQPEVVIEMLNTYLRHEAQIVRKHKGDIDKYVGDELVAVFQGKNMAIDSVRCAIEIMNKMKDLNMDHPQWNIGIGIGINTGEMIMGAMGSEERMDYTILGDNVNLGARLCSSAKRNQVLISSSTYEMIKDTDEFEIETIDPITVKGKSKPIQVYNVVGFNEKITAAK